MRIQGRLFTVGIIFFSFFALSAWGLDSPEILPKGVNSPALRFGQITGIDREFTDRGTIQSLSDGLSVEIDASAIARAEPEALQLISALNAFSPYRYGDQLSLGVLHIDSKPQINYTALVHAWGLSDRWTLGFGIPALKYRNQISVYETGSNVAAYQAQFSQVSPELSAGLARLASTSVVTSFSQELATKGYAPLESKSESLWGDLQIVSLFQFLKTKTTALTHRLTLVLPTGKKDDPNDLADLDLFGRTAIDNSILAQRKLSPSFSIQGRAGLEVFLPDRVDKRVPLNDLDQLPDQQGLETVNRGANWGTSLAGSLTWSMSSFFSTSAGVEMKKRGDEQYSGSSRRSYTTLSKDTGSEAQVGRLGFNFSTVKAYQQNNFSLPMMAGLELNDTLAGKNTPRESRAEFSLTLFY